MYIIPVDAYRQMWDSAGNPSVSTTIDKIFSLTGALPIPPPADGPVLTFRNAGPAPTP